MAKFKRILLKLSGESLMGEKKYGIDESKLRRYTTWACKSASSSEEEISSAD